MRSVFIAAAALAAASSVALAAPAEGPSRKFEGRDIFGLQVAADPQIRPDGSLIAYVRQSYEIMTDRARRSIWLVDPATGAQTPLVSGAGSAMRPRWSPDGKRLAYVAVAEGRPQLFVRWMATGQSARIADLPEAPGELTWSPDGKLIAFSMFVRDDGATLGTPVKKPEGATWADPLKVITKLHYREDDEGYLKPGFDKLFVVGAEGGAPRQLTFGAYDDAGRISWTPDSKAILFSSRRGKDWEREPQDSDIFQLDLATGAVAQLTHRYGPDEQPAASPDGKWIAYLGNDDKLRSYENERVWLMARDGSGARSLTDGLDRSVDAIRWAADGKSLLIQYDDKALTKIARLWLDGRIEPVAEGLAGSALDRPYTGGSFSVSSTGVVAFPMGAPDHPADVAVAGGKGGIQRLTHLNDDLFLGKSLAKVEHLEVKSSADGRPIDAWIALPPNFDPSKKYPLILEIHGGPFSAYGPVFSTDDQLYAAAGYVVLYTNPRGSTSYGAEFANLIHHAYPGQDYDDLISAVDAAIAKGFVDPGNLFVTGGSGGGVLTAWIVGKTDRFKAAATQKPVIDWASFALTSDEYTLFSKYWFGKFPWEDPQGYWARSPLSLVGNVKTPTLVVVGEEDYRTPPSEAEQYYQALQLRAVPTTLVKIPGASHGGIAARPSQSAAKASAILAWFERYRTKGP